MNIVNYAKDIFDIEIKELERVKNSIGETFEQLCVDIINLNGKVVLTGLGKSGIIAQKIAATLASTGIHCVFMHAAEGLHGDLGIIQGDDLVVAISNSGNSPEINGLLPSIRKIGAKIVSICGNDDSQLCSAADYNVQAHIEKEACPMNLAPTSSTTVELVLGDALAATLIKLRQFEPSNFAVYHPGGALGQRLLTRVKDLMVKDGDFTIVHELTPVDEILIGMTSNNIGAAVVCSTDLKLLGIITEGDLRRALLRKEQFFNFVAKDLMTTNPFSVGQDIMAYDALELMENRSSSISVLPVIDDEKVVGVLRIHDIVKLNNGDSNAK